jgi:hypothetical protein
MRHAAVTCLCLLVLFTGRPIHAESRDAFIERVRAAYQAADKMAALKDLFYLVNVDAETLRTYESRIIGRMLGKYENPEIALEPLPKDFDPLQVIGAYEYRPNVKPLGYLVLDGRTRVPYGEQDGRYYLTAVTRTKISPAPPPDKMLQMMVIGMGHPAIRFDGHCDVMLGNGQVRRMTLEDNGHGGNTAIITAQYIIGCDLINKSGRGALSLRLQEAEKMIFKRRVVAPDTTITYRRTAPKPR